MTELAKTDLRFWPTDKFDANTTERLLNSHLDKIVRIANAHRTAKDRQHSTSIDMSQSPIVRCSIPAYPLACLVTPTHSLNAS